MWPYQNGHRSINICQCMVNRSELSSLSPQLAYVLIWCWIIEIWSLFWLDKTFHSFYLLVQNEWENGKFLKFIQFNFGQSSDFESSKQGQNQQITIIMIFAPLESKPSFLFKIRGGEFLFHLPLWSFFWQNACYLVFITDEHQ